MDLAAILSGMPGAETLPGLPEAWHWSPNPRFHFAAALSDDRRHVLQINAMASYDEALVVSVLAFAREHAAQLVGRLHGRVRLLGRGRDEQLGEWQRG